MADQTRPTSPLSVVSTAGAPAAIGPYSQAIRTGSLLFVSGQIPLDPATGQIVDGGIEPQTRQVLHNLNAILSAAGASMADVVKTTVYLVDLSEFAAMNAVYAAAVQDPPPARATVQVSRLPRDARVEIDLIAVLGADAGPAGR
jgi:2-iminobutanoate/2-iminopropanoate deaminase